LANSYEGDKITIQEVPGGLIVNEPDKTEVLHHAGPVINMAEVCKLSAYVTTYRGIVSISIY